MLEADRSFAINVVLVTRAFLAGVFAASGGQKFFSLSQFSEIVRSYEIVPPRLVKPFAFAVTICEIAISAFLVIGVYVPLTASIASLLLAVEVYRGGGHQ